MTENQVLIKTPEEAINILRNFKLDMRQPNAFRMIEAIGIAENIFKEVQQYRKIGTVEECREAVEKQKVFCESAEKYADGKCVGYGKSEMDDEPIEMCKRCKSYVGFEESEEE